MHKEKSSVKASIEYVASVLGVSSFMAPIGGFTASEELRNETFAQAEEAASEELPLEFAYEGELTSQLAFIVSQEDLAPETRELFDRMVQAMKQDPRKVLLLPIDPVEPSQALEILQSHKRSSVIVFGKNVAEQLDKKISVIVTHSLSEVLAQPQLKKVVWQHLQIAMQRLI